MLLLFAVLGVCGGLLKGACQASRLLQVGDLGRAGAALKAAAALSGAASQLFSGTWCVKLPQGQLACSRRQRSSRLAPGAMPA